MNHLTLYLSILGPACLAGFIVLVTHVPLGQQVLKRGIVFIDLALAQVAGLGVIGAQFFDPHPEALLVQGAAALAALAGAVLLAFTDKLWPHHQEPLIGTLFVLAATGSVLMLAHNPHGGEHLKNLLVGQILWVSYARLIPSTIITAVLAAIIGWQRGQLRGMAFYAVFAIAITVSVQLVGVFLVFASLIVPALATSNLHGRRRLAWSYAIGGSGYMIGLLLSAWLDLPSGAVVVWALAACAVAFRALRPGRAVPAVAVPPA